MLIQFERSGGITGIRIATRIDTDMLTPEDAQRLVTLIQAASFFDLPTVIHGGTEALDDFNYVVTIEDGDRRHTVKTKDTNAPDTLRPLLQQLVLYARMRRGTTGNLGRR
jgi:hypothetical protein